MAEKCLIHCADHLCAHNTCSGHYGICALSALSVGTCAGIDRSYVNTCPKKKAIPRCVARGPGKIAVFHHGAAGNGKSTRDLAKAIDTAIAFSLGETERITVDDVMSAIQQFEAVPKPEITPWSPSEFERNYMGIWHIGEED